MTLTRGLIVPVYNEETTLESVLQKLLSLKNLREIILVNDGSRDRTKEILDDYGNRHKEELAVFHHDRNRGKGAALRTGIEHASADFLAVQDSDLEYDPEQLDSLFMCLDAEPEAAVFGSRFLRSNPNLYWTYLAGNKLLTGAINILGGGRLTDAYTCYKLMSRDRWRQLQLTSNGFEIEAEITIKILMKRWKTIEVPIQYRPRSFREGKKIRSTDALRGILKAMECRFLVKEKK